MIRKLGSLRLAVCLLIAFMLGLASATVLEIRYDHEVAAAFVYSSPAFLLFLGLLTLNLACSAVLRFPWKRHQTGFVLTHLGLILFLIGAGLTRWLGLQGKLCLQPGHSASNVQLGPSILFLSQHGQIQEIPVLPAWQKTPLAIAPDLQVRQFLPHARQLESYQPGSPGDPAALHIRLGQGQLWLREGQPQLLGGASLRLSRKLPPNLPPLGEIRGQWQGQPFQSTLNPDPQQPLRLLRYLANPQLQDDRLIDGGGPARNPMIEVEIHSQRWYLFAHQPRLNHRQRGGPDLPLQNLSFHQPEQSWLDLVLQNGKVDYRFQDGRSGPLNTTVTTGWMDQQLQLLQILPQARAHRSYEAADPEELNSAVLIQHQNQEPFWLALGENRTLPDGRLLGYAKQARDSGQLVKLESLEIDPLPGTQQAAAYRVQLRIHDRSYRLEPNQTVTVGDLSYSFGQVQGDWLILNVCRDPGLAWKLVGSLGVVLGITLMFALRPAGKERRPHSGSQIP